MRRLIVEVLVTVKAGAGGYCCKTMCNLGRQDDCEVAAGPKSMKLSQSEGYCRIKDGSGKLCESDC